MPDEGQLVDLGRACYLAYMQTLGSRPAAIRWDAITPEEREAWRAAADAVKMMVEMRQERDQRSTRAN